MRTRLLVLSFGVASLIADARAAAADPQACVGANERGYTLRKEEKLVEARAELLVCAAAGCPPIILEECADLARQVDAEIPSLVIAASAGESDVTDATASIDGVVVRSELDGRAIELNPGKHELKVVRRDGTTRSVSVLARAGEKNRMVRVSFSAPTVVPPPETEGEAPLPVASIVLASVSAVALGLFVGFAVDGFGRQQDLLDGCAPDCAEDDVDAMRRSYLVADISLGTSVVTFGVAAVLFFTRPTTTSPAATSGPAPGLALGGVF